MQFVVFDFDGPIFDGRAAAALAIKKTIQNFESSFAPPRLSLSALALFGPKRIISVLYPDLDIADRNRVCAFYEEHLHESEQNLGIPETVREVLQTLRSSGFSLAIYSGRKTDDLQSLLHQAGTAQYFTFVGGTPTFTKPSGEFFRQLAQTNNISLSEIIYVGDSDWDYDSAIDGKVTYYHAGWTGEPSATAIKKADVVLESLADLVGLLVSSQAQISDSGDALKELVNAIPRNEFSFYAGAGVSVPSGIGGWEDHYHKVLMGLSAGFMAYDSDLPEVIQRLAANPVRAKRVFDAFRASFDLERCFPNAYHFAMLRSNATRIWTSNYDDLFEKARIVGQFGGTRIVSNDDTLLQSFGEPHLVIKMNGDFSSARFDEDLNWGLVFLQEQFDRAEKDRREVWRLFEDDYRQRSIIFVGVSFGDPVLRRILAVARQKISRTRYNHYLITKKATDSASRARQIMHAENLQRASIISVFTDSHDEILDHVQKISLTAYKPIVGFSGDVGRIENEELAANVIPDGMSLTAAEVGRACANLAAQLARNKIRITSGAAPFVGKPAVEAAFSINPLLAHFYLRRHGGSAYRATAPAIVVSGNDYESMRARFISELSLLIAIGGRSDSSGRSGTITEVEMAIDRCIPVLLLTPAGGDVKQQYNRLRTRMDKAYKDETLTRTIAELNDEINLLAPSDLLSYATENLPDRVEKLLRVLMGAAIALQAGAQSRDW